MSLTDSLHRAWPSPEGWCVCNVRPAGGHLGRAEEQPDPFFHLGCRQLQLCPLQPCGGETLSIYHTNTDLVLSEWRTVLPFLLCTYSPKGHKMNLINHNKTIWEVNIIIWSTLQSSRTNATCDDGSQVDISMYLAVTNFKKVWEALLLVFLFLLIARHKWWLTVILRWRPADTFSYFWTVMTFVFPQTELLASCASDRSIVLYDMRESAPLKKVEFHCSVSAPLFFPPPFFTMV